MKYHIYFHDDFDGMASAAVVLDFLRSRGGSALSYNPLNYLPDFNKKWPGYKFKKPFILVDFRYHPAADWWFDHHLTSFLKKEWQSEFRADKTHVFDPKIKSACELVARHLTKTFNYKPPQYLKHLVKWASIVDSASFKSPKQLVDIDEPAIKLMLFMDNIGSEKTHGSIRGNLIKNLSSMPLENVVRLPVLAGKIKKLLAHNNIILKKFAAIPVLRGKVLFANIKNEAPFFSKMVSYYLYPKVFYSVAVESGAGCWHLGAGKNPWRLSGKVNIGKLMSKYGGGGHEDVGGLERKSKKEALKIAEEVIEYLNKHG